jgi:signal transduction histidine kinase
MFLKLKQKLDSLPVSLKVTLWYTMLMTIVFILIMGFMLKFMDRLRISKEKIILQKHVVNTAKHVTGFEEFHNGIYMLLYDKDGALLDGKYPEEFPEDIPFDIQDVQTVQSQNHSYFYYDMHLAVRGSHGQWIRGIISVDRIYENLQLMLQSVLFALPLFFCIAILIGYRIVKQGFRPVETISSTVRSIGEERDLSKRIILNEGGDEIHQMAHTFNEMLDKIEDSVKREKRFSADVSHELRTPVSVIMSESEYGKDFTDSIEEAKESFATIFKQAQHMSRLINELLELARIENPANTPLETLDYSLLLNELAESYEEKALALGFNFSFHIEAQLTVLGNQPLLYLAITNLLDNAFKFAKNNIQLYLTRNGTHALLRICDDGIGMTADELSQSWDRLYQADTNRNTKGVGLGLALVKLITRIHKGRVWAESEKENGSTFFLEI